MEWNRGQAHIESLRYRDSQRREKGSLSVRHFLFYFAKKLMLRRLLRRPGELHFATGLKLDLNGVSSRKTRCTHILGLPEGHCPGDKSAKSVLSIISHYMILPTEDRGREEDTLLLSADNCGRQNKNKSMLWFLAFLVIIGKENRVELLPSYLVTQRTCAMVISVL